MSRSTVAVAIVLGMSSSNPDGVDVHGECDRAFLVGGVDHAEQRLRRYGRDGQQADVVNEDEIGTDQLRDRLVDAVVSAVAADEDSERLERAPCDGSAFCRSRGDRAPR